MVWKAAGLAASLLVTCGPARAGEEMDASWSSGIRLGTRDGSTKIKLGGRVQNDWIFQSGEAALTTALGDDLEDGTEFRRLRFYASGTVDRVAVFKLQLDFAGGKAALKDAYVGVKEVPGLGEVTVGDQYEPFGLEELTSSKYITFLERALTSAFTPERNSGLLATNHNESVTWASGVFRDTDGVGDATGNGEYSATGRLVYRPQNEDDGRKLWHLGIAGSLRSPTDDEAGFATRPENHLAPKYVNTGTLAADRVVLVGLEAATVQGPLSLQGEFTQANVTTLDNTDPQFNAFSVAGSFFLTGEHRRYKNSSATFDRVKPKANYDGNGGKGAWEIAARFSRADLNDRTTFGGVLRDFTGALNWYPNPNFRWMLDYVRADLDAVGTSDALLTRVAMDF